jgi:hypothetical protein
VALGRGGRRGRPDSGKTGGGLGREMDGK